MKIILKESELRNKIAKILNEGTTNKEDIKNWEYIKKRFGAETMLSELGQFLDDITYHEFIEHMDSNYDLGIFNDEEDEDEDEYYMNESFVKKITDKLGGKFSKMQAEQDFMYSIEDKNHGTLLSSDKLQKAKKQYPKQWKAACEKHGLDPMENL